MRSVPIALLALPLAIASLVLAAAGRVDRAVAGERALAAGLRMEGQIAGARPPSIRRAVVAHATRTLPVTVVAFALAAEIGALLVMNLGYPLRSDFDGWDRTHLFSASENTAGSWGGPTLAGAWLVHAGLSVALAALLTWPTRWLARVRVRSAVRRLGM